MAKTVKAIREWHESVMAASPPELTGNLRTWFSHTRQWIGTLLAEIDRLDDAEKVCKVVGTYLATECRAVTGVLWDLRVAHDTYVAGKEQETADGEEEGNKEEGSEARA